ncbi:8962_t:CDS:2 [Funneliformis geosporum]|nr:8962_t:CDS:2 [Funneliformis geosporum]
MDMSDETSSNICNINFRNKEKKGGRPLGAVWLHFSRSSTETPGKFGAECKYCSSKWKRAEISALEEHLASHCPNKKAR